MEIKYGRLGAEHLSDSARKDYLRAIKAVFNWLIKNRKLFVNPAVDVYIKKPRPNPVAWIRQDWFNKMMEKAKGTFWEPVFFLAYYTGLRSGELYALKWEDIDFDENILHVNTSHNWKTKSEKIPKSGQTRMVDISAPELKNFLLKHKKQNLSAEPVYVFTRHNQWEKGHGPAKAVRWALTEADYKPKTITHKVKKEDEAGIMQTVIEKEEIWPNFHSLRASYTMNLLLMNTPILKVQKILGHLDLKTTMHYIGELKKEDITGTSISFV
jgi:integrase